MAADPLVQISARPVPQEPMVSFFDTQCRVAHLQPVVLDHELGVIEEFWGHRF